MAYTVTKLITNAFYSSGIVSLDFQTVSGSQLNTGLYLLNEILGEKFVENDKVPYYTKYDFNAVIGQEKYTIENLIEVESLVFFIDSVRYATQKIPRIQYFGSSRADNVQSLPYSWHLERELGGASIYLYFKPSQAFAMQIWGQFGLTDVALNQDLLLTYDQFYISYLKYALAQRLCFNYNYDVPIGVERQLLKLEMDISKCVSPLDLRMQKVSTLTGSGFISYSQVNLGKGWSVS